MCDHSRSLCRPICVPAALRLVVPLVGMLAVALAMSAGPRLSPDNAAATRLTPFSDVSGSCLSTTSGRSSLQPLTQKPELLSILRCGSRPIHDALRQTGPIPRGGDSRHSEFSVSLVPRGNSANNQSLLQLRLVGGRQAARRHLSLEILFCTWQI